MGKELVRFQLDCGATVNLIPYETVCSALSSNTAMRPPETELLMFDKTKLKTMGMITASITNPITKECHVMDIYITKRHQQPILGSQACQQLRLLTVNEENILALCDIHGKLTLEHIIREYADLFTGVDNWKVLCISILIRQCLRSVCHFEDSRSV